MRRAAAASRTACFDLLKDEKDPNKFYFYEVYKNSNEAIDYHKSMEWYKAWTAFKDSG